MLGGGPAGIEAALAAAPFAEVTLVADRPVGSWHKLLPSRVWMAAVDKLDAARRMPLVDPQSPPPRQRLDFPQLVADVRETARSWHVHQRERLSRAGVKLVAGRAELVVPGQVRVVHEMDTTDLHADAIIVATGAEPAAPPHLAPDGERVFTAVTVDDLAGLPKTLVWIGDGIPSFEFVHMFLRLGVEVTWCVLGAEPRSGFSEAADRFLLDEFRAQGVRIFGGQPVVGLERTYDGVVAVLRDGTRHHGEVAFVNVGQRPAMTTPQLAALGVQTQHGAALTDAYGRTSIPMLYVVGDAAAPQAAGIAMAQGRTAGRHAAGASVEPFDRRHIVITFNSEPQVAQVGRLAGPDSSLETMTIPFDETVKTHITGRTAGFLTLAFDQQQCVMGGLAVGEGAAEALAPIGLAVKLRATMADLAAMFGPHPSVSELPYLAARSYLNQTTRWPPPADPHQDQKTT